MKLESYVRDAWAAPGRDLIDVHSAVTGDVVAQVASGGLDMGEILGHARKVGGPNLRKLTFHQRAEMIKKLAQMLTERKEELYKLSFQTGATRADGAIDIEGGIGTHVRLRVEGPARTTQFDLPDRRRCRAAFQGRQFRRPTHRHLVAGRRGPHQRLQLPLLGHAGKAGARAARRRSGRDQASDRHVLCDGGYDPRDRGVRTSCRRAPYNASSARPAICSTT